MRNWGELPTYFPLKNLFELRPFRCFWSLVESWSLTFFSQRNTSKYDMIIDVMFFNVSRLFLSTCIANEYVRVCVCVRRLSTINPIAVYVGTSRHPTTTLFIRNIIYRIYQKHNKQVSLIITCH